MKPSLQALLIAKEWKKDVISGKQRITIREGTRDYREESVMLCSHLENWAVMADIVSVIHCRVIDVFVEEMAACGVLSHDKLLANLKEYYPDITETSPVTVIRWANVRGKLADHYRKNRAGENRSFS